MKTYINQEQQTTELHEAIKDAQEFYRDERAGFIPQEKLDRIKTLATEKNLRATNTRGQTGIEALLSVVKEVAQDVQKDAQETAKLLKSTMAGISPETIKHGEDILAQKAQISKPFSKPEIFLKKLTLNQSDKNEMLFESVVNNNEQGVHNALAIGANIEARDGKGNTPLMVASHHGSRDALESLIEAGASVTAKNYQNQTALHVQAARADEITERLIHSGADVNQQDIHGRTPIMMAEDVYTVSALQNAGAKVTEETKDFWKNEGKENLATEFEEKTTNARYEKSTEQSGEEAHTQSADEAADEQQGRSA